VGVDSNATPDAGLTLTIPRTGIAEVLGGWSGEGSIFADVAFVSGPEALDWTAGDIRKRARRVLLALIDPITEDWPATCSEWQEWLPSSSVSDQQVQRVPTGTVNWRETRRRYGWPPREFAGRVRRRVMDEVAVGTLAWLSAQLNQIVVDVRSQSTVSSDRVAERVAVISEALSPWTDIAPMCPDRLDLLSLASSGYPWTSVAAAADLVVKADHDPEFIAFELIEPDPDIGWRLFHLATYGMVIRALRNHRFYMSWRRPISGSRTGAQIEAIGPSGTSFDLWFEAASARNTYGLPRSAYYDAVESIPGAGGPIGVDVMLIERGKRALLLECKWSTNVAYVGRYGFHQSASYALDAVAGLADQVWSFVVGPQEIVPTTNVASGLHAQFGVVLGSTSPERIGDVVSAFLADEPSDLT
jgi:hypothetical protein